tara:strand:+ start:2677 stop:2862 length:186 start_codon:yes stop_codon:yes gene_type:complete
MEKLQILLEEACINIISEMKKEKITKKKIYCELVKKLKANTKPKKQVKIARVPFYVSDSSD